MGSIFSSKNSEKNYVNDEITQGYFKDLQTIFIHNYLINDSLLSNMKVCLDEKNFDQVIEESSTTEFAGETDISNPPSNNIHEPTKFINWLDYLYAYLEDEKRKDRTWAGDLLDKLDQEYFLMENKYLSQFFFEEYGLQSIPDCICKKRKRDKKLSVNANTSTLNVTQNLGGSFGESFNQFENENDANFKYKEFRNKVKSYITSFKEHISNKDHPINIVAQLFESVWVEFAKGKLNFMKNNFGEPNDENKKDIEREINELTYQFQKFMIKLQICLKLFYSRTINYTFFNEEKDELINLTTTLVFRTGNIYETMYSIYSYSLTQEITEMSIKYQKLRLIKPEDLGILPQFCLNEETLNMQQEILEKKLKEESEKEENEIKTDEIKEEKYNMDKGLVEIEIGDKKMESAAIRTLLGIIKERKNRIPKPGQRNINDIEVDLNFDEDNSEGDNNVYNNLYNLGKNDSVLIEPNNMMIGSIFPKSERTDSINPSVNVSLDNAHLFKRPGFNFDDANENLLPNNNFNFNNHNIHNNNIINTNITKKNEKKESPFQKKINTEYSETTNDPNMLIIRDANLERKNVVPFTPEKILGRVSYLKQNKDDFLSYPYETAIQLLKQIEKYKTPFEKMMITAGLSNEITDCINDFWQDMERYIKKDFLSIEAEQIMTIFIYVIIKSGITDIFVHCKMIKLFTTCMTKSSMIGYYYSTVEASITYIKTLKNVEELYKNKVFGN